MAAPDNIHTCQSHSGTPSQVGVRMKNDANFPTSTATMPPLAKPMKTVKHPTPMFRPNRS